MQLFDLFYEAESPDGNWMIFSLLSSSYRENDIFYYTVNMTLKDAIKEHIFRDKDEERKTFKGNTLSSYDLSYKLE